MLKNISKPISRNRLFLVPLFLFCAQQTFAQVSITTSSAVTETFTGFVGTGPPANWTVQGSGTRGITWNGANQTTGTNGGWYGNNNDNMSFLGSTSASDGNAT